MSNEYAKNIEIHYIFENFNISRRYLLNADIAVIRILQRTCKQSSR